MKSSITTSHTTCTVTPILNPSLHIFTTAISTTIADQYSSLRRIRQSRGRCGGGHLLDQCWKVGGDERKHLGKWKARFQFLQVHHCPLNWKHVGENCWDITHEIQHEILRVHLRLRRRFQSFHLTFSRFGNQCFKAEWTFCKSPPAMAPSIRNREKIQKP